MIVDKYEKLPEFENIGDKIWRIKVPQPFMKIIIFI